MRKTLLLVAFACPASASEGPRPEIDERPAVFLAQGEQRLVRQPGLVRYSLGGRAARVVRPPGAGAASQLLLKGVAPGQGDLWVWKGDGSIEHRAIHVRKLTRSELPPPLERALGRLDEAQIVLAGAGAILRGEIGTLSESARIAALARAFPKDVHDETELAPGLLALGKARLEGWIRSAGLAGRLRTELSSGTLWVRGALERPSEAPALRRKLLALFPAAELELEAFPDSAPTVHFRVYLLELRRSRYRALGLSWPAGQEGAFQVSAAAIRQAIDLPVALQALEGDGSARILSNPELVVRVPGEAELFAGGELPIRSQGRFFSSVAWKNHGLTLKLKVTHTTSERVRLDVFTEVSHLDPEISSQEVPGLQANRMRTQVDARYGVPLLLSGLLQQGAREKARGLPALRRIPILGSLFGSEDYLKERSELVAILLPASSPPSAPMTRIEPYLQPRGPVPAPRNWISPSEERALRDSPDFPWNALR